LHLRDALRSGRNGTFSKSDPPATQGHTRSTARSSHPNHRWIRAKGTVLGSCWDEHTCDPADDWDPANPAIGHCGGTAMAVLELLGGELLEAEVWQANGERTGVH
jgi:hypothetical protein